MSSGLWRVICGGQRSGCIDGREAAGLYAEAISYQLTAISSQLSATNSTVACCYLSPVTCHLPPSYFSLLTAPFSLLPGGSPWSTAERALRAASPAKQLVGRDETGCNGTAQDSGAAHGEAAFLNPVQVGARDAYWLAIPISRLTLGILHRLNCQLDRGAISADHCASEALGAETHLTRDRPSAFIVQLELDLGPRGRGWPGNWAIGVAGSEK
jgi:hypothetical protein